MNTEIREAAPTGAATCTLPGGYLDENGELHREAVLRPLTGQEEELLTGARETSAVLITRILSRCVDRIGAVVPVTAAVAQHLLVADRLVLLLRLRALTFGPFVQGTLYCPWSGCGARVDVDFTVDDVPVTPQETIDPTYTVLLSPESGAADDTVREVTFRLPNGGDAEVVGPLLDRNAARALTMLLERCVVPDDGQAATDLVRRLSPRARMEVEAAMQRHAPAVDLDMDVQCPECGRAFTAPLDVQDFFLGELRQSRDLLYRQVHYLAYHYHWSEREILDLPREKRQAYIEILASEIEAMNTVG